MGFAEDLAKATVEKKAVLEEYRIAEEMAAAWPAFDPLEDYKRLMAEFNVDVQKAVSVLKENNVPHIIVVRVRDVITCNFGLCPAGTVLRTLIHQPEIVTQWRAGRGCSSSRRGIHGESGAMRLCRRECI